MTHADLVFRLGRAQEGSEDETSLIEQLNKTLSERVALEINWTDESEDGQARRRQFVLERYAALDMDGDSPERRELEVDWPEVVAYARGEGAAEFAELVERERKSRATLPVM